MSLKKFRRSSLKDKIEVMEASPVREAEKETKGRKPKQSKRK